MKSNVFEMGLSYGTKSSGVGNLPFTSQYIGNISAIDWKFKSPKLSGDSKVYTYSYDGISRLKSAMYGVYVAIEKYPPVAIEKVPPKTQK